jgi:glutamate synthase (NADPH/NADH) large chain
VHIELPIRNVNRTVGTMLGHEVTKRYRGAGLPDDTIDVTLTGSAGQSLGAFLPRGITLRLFGDANDYVGKGLSGGRIAVRPDKASVLDGANVIGGNVIGYGATSGEVYLRGRVGERFGVRNSGATLVAEGVGDHACEYMTGGHVLVLGPTGRNVGAGMSGGIAYFLDLRVSRVNQAALEAGELALEALTDADWETVRGLLERHRAETGSAVAAELLADPAAARGRFTRMLPPGWARVRLALSEAEAAGADVSGKTQWDPSVWDQIMEVARG